MQGLNREDILHVKSFRSIVLSWIFFLVVTVVGCVIFMSDSNAFLFQRVDIIDGQSMASPELKTETSFLSSRNDECAPLLRRAHYRAIPATTISDMRNDSSVREAADRRKAGQAVAIALMVGMTSVVTPLDKTVQKQAKSTVKKQHLDQKRVAAFKDNALRVIAYRQCKKQNALSDLGNMRWSR